MRVEPGAQAGLKGLGIGYDHVAFNHQGHFK